MIKPSEGFRKISETFITFKDIRGASKKTVKTLCELRGEGSAKFGLLTSKKFFVANSSEKWTLFEIGVKLGGFLTLFWSDGYNKIVMYMLLWRRRPCLRSPDFYISLVLSNFCSMKKLLK